jgi:hypothetical protein
MYFPALAPWGWIAIAVLLIIAGVAAYMLRAQIASHFPCRARALGVQSLVYSDKERKIFDASQRIGRAIVISAVVGAVAIVVVCGGDASGWSNFFSSLGIDVLVGAAAVALGAAFGFIFAIPRTPDPANRAALASAASRDGLSAVPSAVLTANTNLERISDWLTTLLIGATLVQIQQIPSWIVSLAQFLGLGDLSTNQKTIPFIAVYYFGLSFLGVYLITRLYLTTALQQALGQMIEESGVSETKTNPALNADLARVLAKYLSTGKSDDAEATLEQLKTAVKNAGVESFSKAQLLSDFKNKKLTTGNQSTDDEMMKLLS